MRRDAGSKVVQQAVGAVHQHDSRCWVFACDLRSQLYPNRAAADHHHRLGFWRGEEDEGRTRRSAGGGGGGSLFKRRNEPVSELHIACCEAQTYPPATSSGTRANRPLTGDSIGRKKRRKEGERARQGRHARVRGQAHLQHVVLASSRIPRDLAAAHWTTPP